MEEDSRREEAVGTLSIPSRYRALLKSCKNLVTREDTRLVRLAFEMAIGKEAGEADISRLIDIAMIVTAEIGLGRTSVICVLLHKALVATPFTDPEIRPLFGDKVAQIVKGLQEIDRLYASRQIVDSDNFRKLLLSFAEDVRVQLVFLAEKLYELRRADDRGREEQSRLAREANYIYIPFTHRLGLYNIKSEMEDRALRFSDPALYHAIAGKLEGSKDARERYIAEFIAPVVAEMERRGIRFKTKYRTKTVASILNKMRKSQVEFEEIYDIFAVRFIIDTLGPEEKADCWRVYSIVTDKYTPNPRRLRDWISVPKSNGYESLQTTVLGPGNRWVEVQIRTERMDEIAEKGFAAHWKYKGGGSDKAIENWLLELREILESRDVETMDLLDDIKINVQDKEVHVFTPAGDLKTLPAGATLLDFAYSIHTAVGSRCIGGKVNNEKRNETLRYVLKNGDQITILTSNAQQPSVDWLNIAVTSKARNKIRQFLTENSHARATLGREMLLRRFKNWKMELTDEVIRRLQQHYKYKFAVDFYQALADGKHDLAEIKEFVTRGDEEEKAPPVAPRREIDVTPVTQTEDVLLIDRDVDNVAYKFARCCNPVFGDKITGFVSIGEGIKIHREQCKNVMDLRNRYPYRIVKASWTSSEGETSYQTVLKITGSEHANMMTRISEAIAKDARLMLRGLVVHSGEGTFDGEITVLVPNTEQLSQLISRLKRIPGVTRVMRRDSVTDS
ncbi:MAG: HD domain-containing protein [Odoribacteraceae bacterium]|jgi:GTP pyrophosphokinase|nr:HD domain-containing protein [Odoribacteraceae bacterium]